MAIVKTYSIENDIIDGQVNSSRLDSEIESSGYVTEYDGLYIEGDSINIMGDDLSTAGSPTNESLLDALISKHDGITYYEPYKILLDIHNNSKDLHSISYKSELDSGVSYTPVFYIHYTGENAGFLEKTEYYKNYIDENDPGELILCVEEVYTVDNSDLDLFFTARPALSRIKTWKWVNDKGELDDVNVKVKSKQYNTRSKRKAEGERRRLNIIEQLIDHVGLAGILSGTFVDEDDAYNKLTALQEIHANSFTAWITSGRGSLVDVVEADTETTWLDNVIPTTPYTSAMVPWMIGIDFRDYIQDKLKGLIK